MFRKHWANTLGSVFLLGLAVAALGWWRAPRASLRAPQTGLLPHQDIVITFSAPMQPSGITERLVLRPEHPVSLRWADARTLLVHPRSPWPAGERLTVGIGQGAPAAVWPSLPTLETALWQVEISPPPLLSLWPENGAPTQLYRLHLDDGSSEQLTEEPFGLTGYTVTADGLDVYYASVEGDIYHLARRTGESTLLVDCGGDVCANPQVSPDGTYLAYERTPVSGPPQEALPHVWYLRLESGVPAPLPLDGSSRQPLWSSANHLCVYRPEQAEFTAWNPFTGENVSWSNQTGEGGVWLPDGSAFISPEITLLPNGYLLPTGGFLDLPSSHLIRYPLDGTAPQDLSEDPAVEDASPAVSPDGRYLAFARKSLRPDSWTPGRQVWLLDFSTGEYRPLTASPLYNHTAFAWSPDGSRLAYLRSNRNDFSQPTEIWLDDLSAEEPPVRLLIGGYAPRWIP
ncbi:MAG TPA: hypothetical protein ENJ02_10260 [Chloroflexi bacterium]|nr:hypothetical protein [Chloroflexota bacterium]